MTTKRKKPSAKRRAKVSLEQASASEILTAVKVTRAEERRAKLAVASAKRSLYRVSKPRAASR